MVLGPHVCCYMLTAQPLLSSCPVVSFWHSGETGHAYLRIYNKDNLKIKLEANCCDQQVVASPATPASLGCEVGGGCEFRGGGGVNFNGGGNSHLYFISIPSGLQYSIGVIFSRVFFYNFVTQKVTVTALCNQDKNVPALDAKSAYSSAIKCTALKENFMSVSNDESSNFWSWSFPDFKMESIFGRKLDTGQSHMTPCSCAEADIIYLRSKWVI
jgi:hypothetical protein